MTTSELSLSLKLLIDRKTQKVCFAEAGNNVFEFLSSLLCLPMSTVIKLLTKERMVGSIGNVLDSLEKLDTKYVLPKQSKDPYLSSEISSATICPSQKLLGLGAQLNATTVLFSCQGLNYYTGCLKLSATKGSICTSCSRPMNTAMQQVKANVGSKFLVATATYTIKDDLSMAPASAMSTVTLLAQCGVKDLSTLEEKTVKIGKEEALICTIGEIKLRTNYTLRFMPGNIR